MLPSYIPQLTQESQLELKKTLLNPQPIHIYQPLINNLNEIVAFEFKRPKQLRQLYSFGYSRNEYLYELRSVLDAINLIRKHPDNKYKLIILVSPDTIEKDDFIEHTKSIHNKSIVNRIILCLKDAEEKYPKQHVYINNRLKVLSGLGFQIMKNSTNKSMPFSIFNENTNYLRVSVADYYDDDFNSTSRAISTICTDLDIKVVFSDIQSISTFKSISKNEHSYLQGDFIGKSQKSLINSNYDII